MEALLAEVPVVATKVGGFPEVLPPSAGVLIPPHEPDKLATALIDVLGNDKKMAALRTGTKLAAHKLSFETVLKEQYIPLFNKVIGEKR